MAYLKKKTSYECADADGNRGRYETTCYCSNCNEELTEDDLDYDAEFETYYCPECGEEIDLDYTDEDAQEDAYLRNRGEEE